MPIISIEFVWAAEETAALFPSIAMAMAAFVG